jgi:hypothetical protein
MREYRCHHDNKETIEDQQRRRRIQNLSLRKFGQRSNSEQAVIGIWVVHLFARRRRHAHPASLSLRPTAVTSHHLPRPRGTAASDRHAAPPQWLITGREHVCGHLRVRSRNLRACDERHQRAENVTMPEMPLYARKITSDRVRVQVVNAKLRRVLVMVTSSRGFVEACRRVLLRRRRDRLAGQDLVEERPGSGRVARQQSNACPLHQRVTLRLRLRGGPRSGECPRG